MTNKFFTVLLVVASVYVYAAEPALDKRVPAGYRLNKEIRGDLNGDGVEDYVLIIKGTDKKKIVKYEDTYDLNRRGIMIFFKDGNDYKLVLENLSFLATDDDDCSGRSCQYAGLSVSIDKGNLYFLYNNEVTRFPKNGRWQYTFRYKNSEFELIGYDEWNTDIEKKSVNIPAKKQVVKDCADNSNNKCKEKWSSVTVSGVPILLRNIGDLDGFSIGNYIKEAAGASETSGVKTGTLTDSRDGKEYKTVLIGSKTWMAQNLNYRIGNSWCYDNVDSNCAKYGRLYDWGTAMKACPKGWHLPSRAEWDDLGNSVGGRKNYDDDNSTWHVWFNVGKKLKTKSGWDNKGNGTDDYGFSALPGGFRSKDGDGFGFVGSHGSWWTATEYNSEYGFVYRRSIDIDSGMDEVGGEKSPGISVRCVQDAK